MRDICPDNEIAHDYASKVNLRHLTLTQAHDNGIFPLILTINLTHFHIKSPHFDTNLNEHDSHSSAPRGVESSERELANIKCKYFKLATLERRIVTTIHGQGTETVRP